MDSVRKIAEKYGIDISEPKIEFADVKFRGRQGNTFPNGITRPVRARLPEGGSPGPPARAGVVPLARNQGRQAVPEDRGRAGPVGRSRIRPRTAVVGQPADPARAEGTVAVATFAEWEE